MQALRLARSRALSLPARRCIATTASPNAAHVVSTTSSASSSTIPISNVEAQWEKLGDEERVAVHQQLEELQKKDWKTLSMDEKKAAYYVAFGPYGPRAPVDQPGAGIKIILGTLGVIGLAGITYSTIRSFGGEPPKTMTKEWQEASNERAKEMKLNPITGISSDGYKGEGFVTEK